MFREYKENFWDRRDFKDAHLSKLILDEDNCQKIFTWWKSKENFLLFLGVPGIGKTYLISALINHIKEEKLQAHYLYLKEEDFLRRLRTVIEKGWDYAREIKSICEIPIIFLDDIGVCQMTDWQKEALQLFVDERNQLGFPTVITSNLFLKDLKSIFPSRFMSRLYDKRNTIIELISEDLRQREIVNAKA